MFRQNREKGATLAGYWLTNFKALRGHHGSALSHIRSGVKILSEVESNDDGEQNHGVLMISQHPFVDFRELEILFNRLDSQAAQVCTCSLYSALTCSIDLIF